MKTSTATRHGYRCPRCRDETTDDPAGKGFVRHKNNPHCLFEKGERDDVDDKPLRPREATDA